MCGDNDTKQFVYFPDFEEIGSFSLDTENKKILTHNFIWMGSSLVSEFYTVYSFNGEKYIIEKQIRFELSEDLKKTTLIETEGDVDIQVVKAVYVLDYDYYNVGVDKTDERLKPYYEDGSYWDLDGEKWTSIFEGELLDR